MAVGSGRSEERPSRWRRFTVASAALAATVAAASAFGWHGRASAHGPGMHGGGWSNQDPATMARKLDAMVAWALADIDATPDQRERIGVIVRGAANDLLPLRQSHQSARQESLQLIAAPTIDRARLEALRVQQMQMGDTASRRVLQALADAADVLNAEQRAKLVTKWSERRRWRG
jgi:Spy/CpxP family protein refolding chaperone